MRQSVLLLVTALLILLAMGAGCVSQTLFDETAYVDNDYEVHYSFEVIDTPVNLQISLETDGNPVDLIVLDEENFNIFDDGISSGIFKNFRAIGSNPFIIQTTETYSLTNKGTYYIVIENTDFLPNGADAGQGVKYSITITAS